MTNEELLKVIEGAKARRAGYLDLSRQGLMALPPEIGQLTKLKKLSLGGNPLISPPPEIIDKGIKAIHHYLMCNSLYSNQPI